MRHAIKRDRYGFLRDTRSSISESVPRPLFCVLGSVSRGGKSEKEKKGNISPRDIWGNFQATPMIRNKLLEKCLNLTGYWCSYPKSKLLWEYRNFVCIDDIYSPIFDSFYLFGKFFLHLFFRLLSLYVNISHLSSMKRFRIIIWNKMSHVKLTLLLESRLRSMCSLLCENVTSYFSASNSLFLLWRRTVSWFRLTRGNCKGIHLLPNSDTTGNGFVTVIK